MATITKVEDLLILEDKLSRIAKLYDLDGRITTEYKTIPKPTAGSTECLKRSFIYNEDDQIVGEQVKTSVWTTELENQVSPPINNITLSNIIIAPGLSVGTKIADILIDGGVAPFEVTLTSNPGNIFRIENSTDLVLNSTYTSGSYPITIEVMDDDEKTESQNFTITVTAFTNQYSIQIDGVDESINFGTNPDMQFERTDQFTISGLFKCGSINGAVTYIGNLDTSATPRGWRVVLGVGPTSSIGLQLSNSSSNQLIVHTSTGFADNTWRHFTISYDGTSLASGIKITINGVLQSTTTNVDNLSASIKNTNSVRAGATNNLGQYYAGFLDETALWTKALSVSESQESYNNLNLNAHSAFANLIHWWEMGDGDTFPIIQDKIGANHGTCSVTMEALDIKEDTI